MRTGRPAAICRFADCRALLRRVTMFQTGRRFNVDPELIVVEAHPEYVGRKLITRYGRVVPKATILSIGCVPHEATCKHVVKKRVRSRP